LAENYLAMAPLPRSYCGWGESRGVTRD
jgi:hypothetical protein